MNGNIAQQNALAVQQIEDSDMNIIKPSAAAPALDTSSWPLLLKGYDKLLVRSAHYTPIPAGASPLKRDLASYVKCVLVNTGRRERLVVHPLQSQV